jgi:hypothetical protein
MMGDDFLIDDSKESSEELGEGKKEIGSTAITLESSH